MGSNTEEKTYTTARVMNGIEDRTSALEWMHVHVNIEQFRRGMGAIAYAKSGDEDRQRVNDAMNAFSVLMWEIMQPIP